jgi:hypothetical protein
MVKTFEATTMAVYLSLDVELSDDQRGAATPALRPGARASFRSPARDLAG